MRGERRGQGSALCKVKQVKLSNETALHSKPFGFQFVQTVRVDYQAEDRFSLH
jgi:hypothetical protein